MCGTLTPKSAVPKNIPETGRGPLPCEKPWAATCSQPLAENSLIAPGAPVDGDGGCVPRAPLGQVIANMISYDRRNLHDAFWRSFRLALFATPLLVFTAPSIFGSRNRSAFLLCRAKLSTPLQPCNLLQGAGQFQVPESRLGV